MKKVFKLIGKIVIGLLAVIILLTGIVFASRQLNQSKIDKSWEAYYTHPKYNDVAKFSPKNIGFKKKKFYGDYIIGYHGIPDDIQHKGVVITFGGSDGSTNPHIANYLSSDGYEVVAVYFFGQKGQPEQPNRVPLEIYEEIYSYIQENCKNSDTITILGSSKGAQLALAMSTYYDSIDNLVLIAPSAYVDPGNYIERSSAWTYKGMDLAYYNGEPGVISKIYSILHLILSNNHDQLITYNSSFRNSTNLEEARIKVENSNAKILIFYGDDDRLMDAKSNSENIKKHAKNEIIIHGYENAGHAFGSGPIIELDNYLGILYLNGGNSDSNIEADLDHKRILLETLESWHK